MSRLNFPISVGLILSLLMLVAAGCSPTDRTVGEMSEAEFAQNALQEYVKYALNEKTIANFGFKDLREAESAKVGDPVQVAYITLNSLKEYKASTPLASLVTKASKLYYPVLVNGEVRTKIEILQIEGKWVAGELGGLDNPRIIADVSRKMPELLKESGLAETEAPVLVEIPILHATFFYVVVKEEGFFVTAMVQPERFGLENGRVYPAEKILTILSEVAQEISADELE